MITRRHFLTGLSTLALAGCQVAPGTGKSGFNLLSGDDERKLGQQTHPQIVREFGGTYDDPAVASYVAGIGQRLVAVCETPGADFRFTVLNSPVVNAMALPGGYIYVTRGLLSLCGNEAELAGVVGHEIGHVLGRHTAERVSQGQAAGLFAGILGAVVGVPGVSEVAQMGAAAYLQSFSRDQESEADHLGLRYMSRAGWHPQAMVTMLERLREQARLEAIMAGRPADSVDKLDFMASHPRTLDRVHDAAQEALAGNPQGSFGTDSFLDRMEGMVYGDDPSQGVVRDRVFLHPDGFRFEVPAGFRMVNGEKAVVATNHGGSAIIFDGAPGKGMPDMLTYLTRIWMARASRLGSPERIDINGLDAATATTQGRSRSGPVDVRLVAIRFSDDTVFRFQFATKPNETAALGEDLRRTTYSFRKLNAEEKAGIRPWRIHSVKAGPGDSVDKLAARMAPRQWQADLFRVINGLQAGEGIQPGQRVKLVVE